MQVCGSDEDGDVMLLCDHCDEGCPFGMGTTPELELQWFCLFFFVLFRGGGDGKIYSKLVKGMCGMCIFYIHILIYKYIHMYIYRYMTHMKFSRRCHQEED